MTYHYALFYTESELKKAYSRGEVVAIIANNTRIQFCNKDGTQNGVVIAKDGSFKMYKSERHAQYKVDQLKGLNS